MLIRSLSESELSLSALAARAVGAAARGGPAVVLHAGAVVRPKGSSGSPPRPR